MGPAQVRIILNRVFHKAMLLNRPKNGRFRGRPEAGTEYQGMQYRKFHESGNSDQFPF